MTIAKKSKLRDIHNKLARGRDRDSANPIERERQRSKGRKLPAKEK